MFTMRLSYVTSIEWVGRIMHVCIYWYRRTFPIWLCLFLLFLNPVFTFLPPTPPFPLVSSLFPLITLFSPVSFDSQAVYSYMGSRWSLVLGLHQKLNGPKGSPRGKSTDLAFLGLILFPHVASFRARIPFLWVRVGWQPCQVTRRGRGHDLSEGTWGGHKGR